jgi:hypothetical protein
MTATREVSSRRSGIRAGAALTSPASVFASLPGGHDVSQT